MTRGIVIPRALALVGLFLLVACKDDRPVKSPPPIDTNAPEVPAPLKPVAAKAEDGKACARLRELRCAEGEERPCLRTFGNERTQETARNAGAVDEVSRCVAAAADVVAIRRCGGPSTLTFACPGR